MESSPRLSVARLLIGRGANVDSTTYKGATALSVACKNGRGDLAELLSGLAIRRHVLGSAEEHPGRQRLTDVVPRIASFLVPRRRGRRRVPPSWSRPGLAER